MNERSTDINTHARRNVNECRTQTSVSLLEHHALRAYGGNGRMNASALYGSAWLALPWKESLTVIEQTTG
jgi:hypothetical protein